MPKEAKLIYLMAAVALLLVGGYIAVWKLSAPGVRGGKSDVQVERHVDRDIELLDADGETRHFTDLAGKVWLVSHVFTRCPGQCAGICAALDELRGELAAGDDLHLVSVSLDPAHDDPAQLKAFADKHGLADPNWWFVTGEPGPLNRYMREVFMLAAQEIPEEKRSSAGDLFAHEPRVVLVDRELNMRGWFYPFEPKSKEALRREIEAALAAGKGGGGR